MGAFVAPLSGHLSMALTNYAKRYRQNALYSDICAPRVPVGRQADYYYVWDRSDQMLNFNDLRAPGAGAERVRRSLSTGTYSCVSHALGAAIPDESRANAEQAGVPELTSQMGVTSFLQKKILLMKEYRWASMLTTTNVTNNTTLAGGDQWDETTSDPLANVNAAKKVIRRAGVEANCMFIGEDVYDALTEHADVKDSMKYTKNGKASLQDLAAFFDIENVYLCAAVSVTADSNETASVVFDADDVVICFVDPNASNEDISFMKTFVWAGAPGTVGGYGVTVGRESDASAKADIISNDFYYDMQITATAAGYLIKSAT